MNSLHTILKYALYEVTTKEFGVDFMAVGPFKSETAMDDFIEVIKRGNVPNIQFIGRSDRAPDDFILSLPEEIQQMGDWN